MLSRSPLPDCFPRRCSDLLAVVLASSLTLPFATYTAGPVRVPFAVVSPAYSLVAALYGRKESVDIIERLALSFGTSIAVIPPIGWSLDYTLHGTMPTPVLVSVYGFIILM